MKKRAPDFFIEHNLEWFYRIFREPKRIKRFYKSNIRFMWKIHQMKAGESLNEQPTQSDEPYSGQGRKPLRWLHW